MWHLCWRLTWHASERNIRLRTLLSYGTSLTFVSENVFVSLQASGSIDPLTQVLGVAAGLLHVSGQRLDHVWDLAECFVDLGVCWQLMEHWCYRRIPCGFSSWVYGWCFCYCGWFCCFGWFDLLLQCLILLKKPVMVFSFTERLHHVTFPCGPLLLTESGGFLG